MRKEKINLDSKDFISNFKTWWCNNSETQNKKIKKVNSHCQLIELHHQSEKRGKNQDREQFKHFCTMIISIACGDYHGPSSTFWRGVWSNYRYEAPFADTRRMPTREHGQQKARPKRITEIILLNLILSYLLSIRGNKHIIRLLAGKETDSFRDISRDHFDGVSRRTNQNGSSDDCLVVNDFTFFFAYCRFCRQSSYPLNISGNLLRSRRSGCDRLGRRARILRPRIPFEQAGVPYSSIVFLSLHLRRAQQCLRGHASHVFSYGDSREAREWFTR